MVYLPHQPEHTALGEAVPLAKLGSGCARNVLGDQEIDRLGLQPLPDPTFSATAMTPSRSSWQRTHDVCKQGGVQFESPQADHCSALSEHISIVALELVALSQVGPI
jgi:hypothetical protein